MNSYLKLDVICNRKFVRLGPCSHIWQLDARDRVQRSASSKDSENHPQPPFEAIWAWSSMTDELLEWSSWEPRCAVCRKSLGPEIMEMSIRFRPPRRFWLDEVFDPFSAQQLKRWKISEPNKLPLLFPSGDMLITGYSHTLCTNQILINPISTWTKSLNSVDSIHIGRLCKIQYWADWSFYFCWLPWQKNSNRKNWLI